MSLTLAPPPRWANFSVEPWVPLDDLIPLVAERIIAFRRHGKYRAHSRMKWGPSQPLVDKYGEDALLVTRLMCEALALANEIEGIKNGTPHK